MTLVKRGKSIIGQDSLFKNFDLLKKENTSILSSPCGFFFVVSVFEVSNLL